MTDEKKALLLTIEELNNRVKAGTISPEEEKEWREDILTLQHNFLTGEMHDEDQRAS